MMEAHEVERLLKQLLGLKVPPREIQTLPLGHFYVVHGTEVTKAYALPAGVPEDVGRKVAMGELTPEYVRDHYLSKSLISYGHLERPLREEIENLKKANKDLETRHNAVVDQYGKLAEDHERLQADHNQQSEEIVELVERLRALKGMENIRAFFVNLIHDEIESGRVLLPTRELIEGRKLEGPSEINVTQEVPTVNVTRVSKVLNVSGDDLLGRLTLIYSEDLLPKGWFRPKHVGQIMGRQGWKWDPRTSKMLIQMCQWNFLETRQKSHKAREYHVKMTPKEAQAKGLLSVKEVKA